MRADAVAACENIATWLRNYTCAPTRLVAYAANLAAELRALSKEQIAPPPKKEGL